MKTGKVFMFPGQGSQVRGMGADLFDQHRELAAQADEILGYSIKELCLQDPQKVLTQTDFTQPALFTIEAMSYLSEMENTVSVPDYLIGHSLGEFAALFAAGVFDFATGLTLVKKRGSLMASAPRGGGMAAVIGLNKEEVSNILRQPSLASLDFANDNAPDQCVIAGKAEDIQSAKALFEREGARYVPLNVSAAFHSRYMAPIQDEFRAYVRDFDFGTLTVPVISNVTALPHDAATIKDQLVQQISSPVQWTNSINFLLNQAAQDFIEIGPGHVLTGLLEKIRTNFKATPLPIEIPTNSISSHSTPPIDTASSQQIETLSTPDFRETYEVGSNLIGGSLRDGVASADLVIAAGKNGFFCSYGAQQLGKEKVLSDIARIKAELGTKRFGVGFVPYWKAPEADIHLIEALLKAGVETLELSGLIAPSLALVRFRLTGARLMSNGHAIAPNTIIAKVTRPSTAISFMAPPPPDKVKEALARRLITEQEAEAAPYLPLAQDICAHGDAAGQSNTSNVLGLLPVLQSARDRMRAAGELSAPVRIGASGGFGHPKSIAAGFMMGADFVMITAPLQCTYEAGTSSRVKEMLQVCDVDDCDYAPAGQFFEQGGQSQVLRKGVFFPARARKLYSLWQYHDAISKIDSKTRIQLEKNYFANDLEQVWHDVERRMWKEQNSIEIEHAQSDEKTKMGLVFKQYFRQSVQYALQGQSNQIVNFQIQSSSAMGAVNNWIGHSLWEQRHAADLLSQLNEDVMRVMRQGMSASIQ
ncbi:ACP S-malonyltransferase [Tateyamaria sp.]|nr:ACP S-malonyltransferase [Tateyamaria sp.]